MATEVLDAVQQINAAAVSSATEATTPCVTRRLEIGSVIQQGDVYLHHVDAGHPRGEQTGAGSCQIALGESNGAKHVAAGAIRVFRGAKLPPGFTALRDVEATAMLGPVVLADEAWDLQHPEHRCHRLPAGVYQVTYQYDPRTMRRVAD